MNTKNKINSFEFENFDGPIQNYLVQMQLYNAVIKEVKTKLEILDEEFSIKHEHNPIHNIESRLKNPKSILEKLKRKGLPFDLESVRNELNDIAGIRVICNYEDDVFRIADMLISQDDVTLIKKSDYITNPKDNGYRSLHLVVEVPIFLANKIERVRCEVQLRTIAMDFWASLEHKLRYKKEDEVPEDIKTRLRQCADAIAAIDNEMQDIHKKLS